MPPTTASSRSLKKISVTENIPRRCSADHTQFASKFQRGNAGNHPRKHPLLSKGWGCSHQRRMTMKREFIIAATALSIFAGSEALAQTAVIQLSPDQRVRIKEYIVREKVRPVVIKDATIGTALPSDVELLATPPTWGPGFVNYRYVYAGDHVL